MKKVREFFRDLADNNPWTIAILLFIALCFFCHWLSTSTVIGEIQKQ